MYKVIIESESLDNKEILKEIDIVRSYKEEHLDENPSVWTINKIKVNENDFNSFVERLSKSIVEGWYSLLWNKEFVYVVFKNKIFKINNKNPWNVGEFNKIVNYGTLIGIKRKYFDELRKTIEDY